MEKISDIRHQISRTGRVEWTVGSWAGTESVPESDGVSVSNEVDLLDGLPSKLKVSPSLLRASRRRQRHDERGLGTVHEVEVKG